MLPPLPPEPWHAAHVRAKTCRPATASPSTNVRLSADTCDPQLNAPHAGCICSSGTFIGDYFGIDSDGTSIYTTSVSTYDGGANPWHYQQQLVAKVAIP